MKRDYILFDLDGTLTDPGEGITNSVAYALNKYGIEVSDRTALYKFIGPPLYESFEVYYGFTHEQAIQAVEYYREYYKDKGIFENLVYHGIPELLHALKDAGKKILLATSKPEAFARQILDHFHLTEYFDVIVGADMHGSLIRKADIIDKALTLGGADPSQCIMVGDREHDVLGAAAHGIPCIGVLFGYGSLTELDAAGAYRTAASADDVLKIVLTDERNEDK